MRRLGVAALALIAVLPAVLPGTPAAAQERGLFLPTVNDYGGVGLIEMPTARTAPPGWAILGASAVEPYRHGFLGFQPLPWLGTTLRYSHDVTGGPDQLAGDVALVLARETAWRPQVVLGLRSLVGDGALSSEYLAFSKRFGPLDLTAGFGWGRFAGRGHLPNPLTWISGHFERERTFSAADDAAFDALFTGEQIGLFGGVQMLTPVPGLSVMLEYSPDDFAPERRRDPGLALAVPVNVGIAWRPAPWLDTGLALEQGTRIMARAALTFDPGRLPMRRALPPAPPVVPRSDAPADADADAVAAALAQADIPVTGASVRTRQADIWITADPTHPIAPQIGHAARALTAAAPRRIDEFGITVGTEHGLETATVAVMRGDLERAARHAGSPAEIWRNAELTPPTDREPFSRTGSGPAFDLWVDGRVEFSPFDPEKDRLYRTSLLVESEARPWRGFVLGAAARLNGFHDLVLPDLDRDLSMPVRTDALLITESSRVRMERAYVGHLWMPEDWPQRGELFARMVFGYLEEAYAGVDTEVLWRPFGSRFAVGAELANVIRRDPFSQYRLLLLDTVSAHLDLYYQAPVGDLDLRLSAGRYLAGDLGGTVEVARRFDNGIRIAVYATMTDRTEPSGRIDQGLRITLPLQRLPLAPRSTVTAEVAPLLRDAGQRLDAPLRLYELTDPASYRAIAEGWGAILD
jgi:hypothetical protein